MKKIMICANDASKPVKLPRYGNAVFAENHTPIILFTFPGAANDAAGNNCKLNIRQVFAEGKTVPMVAGQRSHRTRTAPADTAK